MNNDFDVSNVDCAVTVTKFFFLTLNFFIVHFDLFFSCLVEDMFFVLAHKQL